MNICLINLPRFEVRRPPLALATLSALCADEGFDYSCVDFSLKIWQELPKDFHDIDDFCITKQIEPEVKLRLQELIDDTVNEILSNDPESKFVMSLLSTWSHPVCELFCESIRAHCNNQILIGGGGLVDKQWTMSMLKNNEIDFFIIGEGEITFKKFLRGETTAPGLNNFFPEQIDKLDEYCVIPDYRKLPLADYPYLGNNPDLYITASRGCVRNCGYCDINHHWKKYRYRSAKLVAQEMITQYERHGIEEFFFTDSLVNGSLKVFEELCDNLIDYKKQNPKVNFKWRGQYIFRPKHQVPEGHFKKMVDAGVQYLIIGLETFSDRVRFDMDKKHTSADAEWHLEMFKKHGISCQLLMLTGWVTETEEDHKDTLSMFSRLQKYVASGTITGIELGSTLYVLDYTPVMAKAEQYGLSFINDNKWLWQAKCNPKLTVPERIRRRIETHYEAMKYYWPITRSHYRLSAIKKSFLQGVEGIQQQN